jgi:catechol 2,3-dioxygenase-like lactoylglutathione lyase family enzyme
MIRVKLTSIIVDDQNKARTFYTEILGFVVKHDIPMGMYNWLTLVSPDDLDGVEIVLEPTGHPASQRYQKELHESATPLTALAVDDMEKEYARLKTLGVVFQSEPKRMGDVTIAVFDDTCGNYIQIFQA